MVLLTRSLPTLSRQAGPTARRALHSAATATSRRCGVASRPALAQLVSKRTGCLGLAATNQMGQVRLLTGEKREKVKVLAVLYDGGKHAEEVRKAPPPLSPQVPSCMHHNSHPKIPNCYRFPLERYAGRRLGMRGIGGAELFGCFQFQQHSVGINGSSYPTHSRRSLGDMQPPHSIPSPTLQ
jgi:hypothetical protein